MGSIPQHVSIFSLGTHNIDTIRQFYRGWGWSESPISTPEFVAFDVGSAMISFYDMEALAEEAHGDARPEGQWGGFTLAMNVSDQEELDRVYAAAVEAGATPISEPTKQFWGGIAGYVSDPDGNRWELSTGGPKPAPVSESS